MNRMSADKLTSDLLCLNSCLAKNVHNAQVADLNFTVFFRKVCRNVFNEFGNDLLACDLGDSGIVHDLIQSAGDRMNGSRPHDLRSFGDNFPKVVVFFGRSIIFQYDFFLDTLAEEVIMKSLASLDRESPRQAPIHDIRYFRRIRINNNKTAIPALNAVVIALLRPRLNLYKGIRLVLPIRLERNFRPRFKLYEAKAAFLQLVWNFTFCLFHRILSFSKLPFLRQNPGR